ncbi:hypothetical protein EIN_505500 [Entamoeba invadens IP1]|uniref:Uncharacterized protein n=1 Tax=Entamoeba invadens IP1 TaxID=370355 RepID=A0A0A1U7J5_ENTIV|nr:hypothetical protein EIN_505500 [Entamoeba invadens IP1]ELP90314.1 hypothetical protein EIN_505500 [Entamoeba invadens IP1]|eukprot:XP_004257085.1 hypothetical protein EIN_505500 [Entamoeba invadens IP1]
MNDLSRDTLFLFIPDKVTALCLVQINKEWLYSTKRVSSSGVITSVKSNLTMYPNLRYIEGDVEDIENNSKLLRSVLEISVKYKACYFTRTEAEYNFRPKIVSIKSVTNCFTPFTGLLGMTNLRSIKLRVSFDNEDSDDSENDISAFASFFAALKKLTSLKTLYLYCNFFDTKKIIKMIDLKITVIFLFDEFFDLSESLKIKFQDHQITRWCATKSFFVLCHSALLKSILLYLN